MDTFVAKPVKVKAVQFDLSKASTYTMVFAGTVASGASDIPVMMVNGKQGSVPVFDGNWIIEEPDGSGHYPCADSVFRAKYLPEGQMAPLPVAGYVPQSSKNVDIVNVNKYNEEMALQQLDVLAEMPDIDKRWLAIGRTHLEQAWMAINRAVFKPQRVKIGS